MEILSEQKAKLCHGLKIGFVVFLAVFVANALFKHGGYWDENIPNTISFSGHGEVNAVPDIANIYFTISKDSKTVKEAQASVAVIEKKALDLLKSKGVEDKDIKTANASFNPKYAYQEPCFYSASGGIQRPCINGPTISGYEASESITVKVRNTDSVGDIMQGLGATGVSNLNGPNFVIDKEDALKAEVRKIAIDDAKQKARILAKDLGVRLGKITSFNENGNFPIYYGKAEMMSVGDDPSASAVIPKGENTISSDVTITYEIR